MTTENTAEIEEEDPGEVLAGAQLRATIPLSLKADIEKMAQDEMMSVSALTRRTMAQKVADWKRRKGRA